MTNKVIIIIIIIIIIITNCHLANIFDEFFSKTSILAGLTLKGKGLRPTHSEGTFV